MWFSSMSEILTFANLVHAISGGLGSAVSITIVYPLETARTRLQVDHDVKPLSSIPLVKWIFKREGLTGLYRGWGSLVLALFLTNFTYFYVFHGLRHVFSGGALAATDLGCASVAGVITVLISNPVWVVNTRLKLQGVPGASSREIKQLKRPRYRGVIDCFAQIIRDEGVRSLWAGTASSLLLVANPALQFVSYEALKRGSLFTWAPTDSLQHVCNGVTAKMVATILTYPLQVVQTQRRAGFARLSMMGQMAATFKENGIMGLFRGLETKLTQTLLTAAIMFVVYEKLAATVFGMAGVER
jgi:adenine nucleotide transporter 17